MYMMLLTKLDIGFCDMITGSVSSEEKNLSAVSFPVHPAGLAPGGRAWSSSSAGHPPALLTPLCKSSGRYGQQLSTFLHCNTCFIFLARFAVPSADVCQVCALLGKAAGEAGVKEPWTSACGPRS